MANEKVTVEKIRKVSQILNANQVTQDDRMMAMYSEACGTVFIMSNGDIFLSDGQTPTVEQGKALMKEFGIK